MRLRGLYHGLGDINRALNTGKSGRRRSPGVAGLPFQAANGAPFFGLGGGQSGSDQGADENGVVTLVSSVGDPFAGFANIGDLGPDGVPSTFNFNDTSQYTNGIATITISAVAVPEPSSLSLLAAFAGCGFLRRRRK